MTDPSPQPPQQAEWRVRVLLDRMVSASAGIVALCALGVSIYQAMLSREQQRISLWPYLMQYNSGAGGHYRRIVQNAGLGPALIANFEVYVDDKPRTSWSEVMRAMVGTADSTLTYSSLGGGMVLLPGNTVDVLDLKAQPLARAFHAEVDKGRMRTRVCFCSLYEECWIADSREARPTRTRACVVDSSRAFQQ